MGGWFSKLKGRESVCTGLVGHSASIFLWLASTRTSTVHIRWVLPDPGACMYRTGWSLSVDMFLARLAWPRWKQPGCAAALEQGHRFRSSEDCLRVDSRHAPLRRGKDCHCFLAQPIVTSR